VTHDASGATETSGLFSGASLERHGCGIHVVTEAVEGVTGEVTVTDAAAVTRDGRNRCH
jgi:hypothetical protein